MRDSHTLHCPPLLQFWIVAQATPGQVLPVSTTKRSQKEVSLLELSKSKSTVQREVGCWCFQKLASCTWKESYTLLQPRSVFKVCKGLKKRFEDLHSLSLNFCLTKFVRTIEQAFVQVSHSFAKRTHIYRYASCIWPGALPEKKQIELFSKFILCFATFKNVQNFILYLSTW